MAENFGLISVSDYKGLSLHEATEKAISRGFTCRIVEENGTQFMVTMDLRNNRLNFRVNNDIIIDVYPG